MGAKLFDVSKQYSCMEVHRLEALRELAITLEDIYDETEESILIVASKCINEFIDNLVEQEKRGL